MQGLDWQTVHIPLMGGVNQKADDRALQPPALQIAKDVQFDEHGGLQTRRPFSQFGVDLATGGTVTDWRRIMRNGDELLAFTKDALISWDDRTSKWVRRATHLAVSIDERSVYTTTGDQVDGDRAEMSGLVLFAWTEGTSVFVAAHDRATGGVFMAPTAVTGTATRPRLVALTTKILLFFHTGTDGAPGSLVTIPIDPAVSNPTTLASTITGSTTTVLASPDFGSFYDVSRIGATDVAVVGARRVTTTSYTIAKVTAGAVVTASTKARTCDGPIAVSADPNGTTVQVIRANVANIHGDRLTVSTLADEATGQAVGTAVGTPVNQIAACHKSVQDSGQFRCHAFWSAQEGTGTVGFECKTNFVDTGGTIGTQSVLAIRLGVASRAFDHDGRVFVWLAFAGESAAAGMGEPLGIRAQLQNTYFLYRDDSTLHSRSLWQRAGGLAPSTGRLPGVSLLAGSGTDYGWCGTERRIIPLGDDDGRVIGRRTGYADRGPVDVQFTFDSNAARRVARLGQTLYITGGIIQQYDGEGLTEVGFLVYPWLFATVQIGGGSIPDGKYSYKSTLRWDNARGERERSTTATGEQPTISGGPAKVDFSIASLHVTLKQGTRRPPAQEIWRTAVNPPIDAPFFLITSNDPGVLTGDNRYIANNAAAAFAADGLDNLTDAVLTKREANPENNEVLESLAPPPATIIAAYGSRVFLGGVAGQPRRVWYSRLRGEGEIVGFHDALSFELPLEGGDLVAIAFMDGTLVALCERAVYAVPGDGLDNLGDGNNYGPARIISHDVGCRDHDSVAVTPSGVVFHTSKGKYLLNRGFSLDYIGGPVADFDSQPVVAAHVDEHQHQVRWLTDSRIIIYDYAIDPIQWSEWSESGGLHATPWNGQYLYLTSAGPQIQISSHLGTDYGIDVELPWIKPADLQGAVRARCMMLLGEFRSSHHVRVRISYDFNLTVVDDRFWSPTPAVIGGPEQVKILPSRQQFQAVKLRITAVDAVNHANPPSGEALKLTGLALELGYKRGLHRRLSASQRV